MTLKDLPIGKTATITSVSGEGALRQHFLDMGVIPNAEVTMMKYAPLGDPVEIKIHGYELILLLADAEKIGIKDIRKTENTDRFNVNNKYAAHKSLGEHDKFYVRTDEQPMPDNVKLTFALVGNQNCGKTTLFNQLTGSNQHVGNFPGVTVDRKDGVIKGNNNTLVTDLPGIYSMSPYSKEEIVTRQFILDEKPKGIINIVDATNIERNLYLTMQLMELDIPMVLALNMMDEVKKNGGFVYINRLEKMLGIPVVPISAARNEGIDELVDNAIHVAKYQKRPEKHDLCDTNYNRGALYRCLQSTMHIIENHAKASGIPARFAAGKLIESDSIVIESLKLDRNEQKTLEHIIAQMENESGLDRAAAMADMRFSFISRVCSETVVKPKESREHIRSIKIDKFLTGKYTAIPAFALIMAVVFWLTFSVIGSFLSFILEHIIEWFANAIEVALNLANVNAVLKSLILDGMVNGVGSVLGFLPVIITLFFFLSILEDSGYMARVAFVMDKLLRKIGLSGRSIVPMLIGFGCSVPGVMASRTLPSERDRKMTVLLTPYMSCSAKIPIYGFFADEFFPKYSALVMIGLYFTGILIGIAVAMIMRKTMFKGEAVPFVMELPNYRTPAPKNVMQLLWEKAKDFLQRAFTIIFIATIAIWFLQTFDLHLKVVTDSKDSILAIVAGWISPVFKPLGFGDWRVSTSLMTGFMAKESVVSTLSILFGRERLRSVITPLSAMALLVFCLLYTPCVAAITSIKRELGGKWAICVVFSQCVVAWIAAYIIIFIGSLII